MSGFFIIGSFFAMHDVNLESLNKLILLCFMSFSIVFSVYCFNAAAGKEDDQYNVRLKSLWNITKKKYLLISLVFYLISACLCIYLNPITLVLTSVIIGLWILYSHPIIGLKRKAIWGTIVHFFGQILHFNLAYLIFQPININSILISIYFSIAFSSGHLLHEIIDYESDKTAGLNTSTVVFGPRFIKKIIILILSFNLILISILGYLSIFELIAFISFIIASTIHLLLLIIMYFHNNINPTNVRNIYRCCYFLGGIIYLFSILYKSFLV